MALPFPMVKFPDTDAVPVTSSVAVGLVFLIPMLPLGLITILPVLESPRVRPALLRAAMRLLVFVPPNTKFPLVVALPVVPEIWKRALLVAVPPMAKSLDEIPGEMTVPVESICQKFRSAKAFVLHVTTPPLVVVSPVHELNPVRVVFCPLATVSPALALMRPPAVMAPLDLMAPVTSRATVGLLFNIPTKLPVLL